MSEPTRRPFTRTILKKRETLDDLLREWGVLQFWEIPADGAIGIERRMVLDDEGLWRYVAQVGRTVRSYGDPIEASGGPAAWIKYQIADLHTLKDRYQRLAEDVDAQIDALRTQLAAT